MKKISLILIAVSLPVLLFSLEFHHSMNDLLDLISTETPGKTEFQLNSQWQKGSTLLEILPLMEEVHTMRIHTERDVFVLNDEKLAEYWSESYLINRSGILTLSVNGITYNHVNEIRYSGTPLESDDLEIWLSWEGIEELKEELDFFARSHQIHIKSIEVPRPESKLIAVIRAGGNIPDIIMLQSSAVENLVSTRALQNLDYISTQGLMSQGKEAFSFENRLWALPFYSDTQVFFYNKDIVKDAISFQWTLEDMVKLAGDINRDSIYPLVWNGYSSNWLIPFQFSFGKTELIDSRGGISVNDPATRKALSYIVDLQEKGLLTPMERDAMDALFIAGKVAMIISGSYSIPYFETLGLNFGVLPLPLNSVTGFAVSPLLDFKGLGITRKTDSPILARRIVQFLTSPAVQQRFCPSLAKLPARNDILEIPGIPYRYAGVLNLSAERGITIPPLNVYSIYKNNMWKLLRFALSGNMSVRQTLEHGQTLMENTTDN